MKNLFVLILLSISFLSLNQINPTIKWSFDTNDAAFGQAAAGDLDGDGKLEIVFGCYRNDSTIYALNADDGSLLWKYNTGGSHEGCNDVAPLIYDVDGDGLLDVIVPSSCTPRTYCFEGATGEVKWACTTRGSDSPPTIGRLGDDGRLKILHGEFGGYVICIDAETGLMDWEIAVDIDSWIQTAPTILDIGNDGDLDFVVATWNAVDYSANKVYAYRAKDQQLLWTHDLSDVVYHGTAVGDLDGDGNMELIIGCYNDTLYCLNAEDGTVKWTYSAGEYFYVGGPAQIADLDGDGKCEVIFSTWYKVIALTSEGEVFWEYNIPEYQQSFRGAAIADVNGDEYLDVVFGTLGGNVIGLNGKDRTVIFNKDLASHYGNTLFEIDHAPLIADFDQDGTIDVFVVGGHAEYPDFFNDFGRAYMMSVGPGNGPDWLMFQNDPWRQSNICVNETSGLFNQQKDLFDINVYPNPIKDFVTISINLDKTSDVTIEIWNTLGEKVDEISKQTLLEGANQLSWNRKNEIAAGVYHFLVKVNEKKSYHKVVLE